MFQPTLSECMTQGHLHIGSNEKRSKQDFLQALYSSCGSLLSLLSDIEIVYSQTEHQTEGQNSIDILRTEKALSILGPYLRPELVEQCNMFLALDVQV